LLNAKDKETFDLIVKCFYNDIMFSADMGWSHPYYKVVIGWGISRPSDIIPLLLQQMEVDWIWCGALHEIVAEKESPHIPEEYAGMADHISKAWLAWGKANGYL